MGMIIWQLHQPKRLWVVAYWDIMHDRSNWSIDEELNEVARWCRDTECGKRMSYDMFKLKSEKALSMFLLRWA